jgi:HK97 family phage major capsid protein
MSTLINAQKKMKKLAALAEKTYLDSDATTAQKVEKMGKIQEDLNLTSGLIQALTKGAGLATASGDGEGAVQDASSNLTLAGAGAVSNKSIGQSVVEDPAYKAFLKGFNDGSGQLSTTAELGRKASGLAEGQNVAPLGDILQGQGGANVTPYFLPGIVDLRFQPLVVADLFAQGTTDSPTITYVKETSFNPFAATTVAEANETLGSANSNAGLPPVDDTVARIVEIVSKIGVYLKLTDEMVQDAPAYASFLNGRLLLAVRLAEQNLLLNGVAGGSNNLVGLLNRSGLQTSVTSGSLAGDGAAWADALYNQMTNARWNAFVEPDAIVMHPLDWAKLRLSRDTNNQYFAGGPFTGAYGQNGPFNSVDTLWGKPVVQTPSIAQGTALTGGFRECGQIFRRQGITVEMTNVNQDDFINNLITVRAYERLALAVYRTNGFGTVKLTP